MSVRYAHDGKIMSVVGEAATNTAYARGIQRAYVVMGEGLSIEGIAWAVDP